MAKKEAMKKAKKKVVKKVIKKIAKSVPFLGNTDDSNGISVIRKPINPHEI